MDWDALDINENGNGSSSIGVVESKMPNLVTNGKECERNRVKGVNGGKLLFKFKLLIYRERKKRIIESLFRSQLKTKKNVTW